MKLKLFITALGLLLVNGCNSGGSAVSGGDTSIVKELDSDTLDVDNPDIEEPVAKVIAGWYMRTVAKATLNDGTEYIHNTAGIMGELKESLDGKDKHDIEAFGTPVLSVVFTQKAWAEENGDYFSDYRQFTEDGTRQVWTFQVKNRGSVNLRSAALQLTLEDPYTVYEVQDENRTKYKEELAEDKSRKNNIILVDVDMQKEYSYAELETAELNMEGNVTRTFRWVLGGETTTEDYAPLATPLAASKLAKTINTTSRLKASGDKFGLPPQL
jgi:hypothetical protein